MTYHDSLGTSLYNLTRGHFKAAFLTPQPAKTTTPTPNTPDADTQDQISRGMAYPDITGMGITAKDFLDSWQNWVSQLHDQGVLTDATALQAFGDVKSVVDDYMLRSTMDGTGMMNYNYTDMAGLTQDPAFQAVVPPDEWKAVLATQVFTKYAQQLTPYDPKTMTDKQYQDAFNKNMVTAMHLKNTVVDNFTKTLSKSYNDFNSDTSKQQVIDNLRTRYGLNDPNNLPSPTQLKQAYEMSTKLQNQGYPALMTDEDFAAYQGAQKYVANVQGNYAMASSEFDRGILNQLGFSTDDFAGLKQPGQITPDQQSMTPEQQVIDQQVKGANVSGGNTYKENYLQNRLTDTTNALDPNARNAWLNAINAPQQMPIADQIAALQAERNKWAGAASYKGLADSGGWLDLAAQQAQSRMSEIDTQINALQGQTDQPRVVGEDPLVTALKQSQNGWLTDYYAQAASKRGLYSGQFAPQVQWK